MYRISQYWATSQNAGDTPSRPIGYNGSRAIQSSISTDKMEEFDDNLQAPSGPAAQPPVFSAPPQPLHVGSGPGEPPTATLRRLLWLFASLVCVYFVLFMLRPLVRDLEYARSYGREKARVEAAVEGLEKVDLSELTEAFRLVAQRTGPSVVHIRTIRTVSSTLPDEGNYFFGKPRQFQSEGQGSGVVVDEAGYIVTNNHVISGSEEISVHLSDGRELSARVVGSDPLTDVAVLKVEADGLIPLEWGDSDQMEPGDMVWAVGSPYGLERSVTFGIVSAKGRPGRASPFQDFLQSDAAVNPGNSGGPLVNMRGEIVGLNTAIVGQVYQGVSFAIPSATAKVVYEALRQRGRVPRGWLGVSLEEVTDELATNLKLPEPRGALIHSADRNTPDVWPNSPAARVGIRVGDVIIGWNSQPVDNPTTLSRLVADTKIGSRAEVELVRNGRRKTLHVTVAERTIERTMNNGQ